MRLIHFIQIGDKNSLAIHNLVNDLNSVQSEFVFSFHDDIIKYPEEIDLSQPVYSEKLETLVGNYISSRFRDRYPVAICDCQFEEDMFSVFGHNLAIISTYYWANESSQQVQHCIAFTLIDIILNLYIDAKIHYESIGCPMDYCSRGQMKEGLARCNFCSECQYQILKSIETGKITLQQKVAIDKILDLISGRKYCFVIMPFHKSFDKIFNCIQSAFNKSNWVCNRADEIYEPTQVVNIIWEQILRSNLIISDLTGRNANVFYELGYAHALGKNTILITQSIDDIPFDLRHLRCIEYSKTAKGYRKLSEIIQRYLQGPRDQL